MDKSNMGQVIDLVIDKSNLLDNEVFYKYKSNKLAVDKLDNIMKEVL
jgi:hypothetical protein